MKNKYFLICFLYFAIFQAHASEDISGIWTSSDYQCPAGVEHTEKIKIEKHGSVYTAIKLIGDDCVPTGYVTFFYDINTDNCRGLAGQPFGSPSTLFACQITIVDEDSFVLSIPFSAEGTLVFKKISPLETVTIAPNLNINIPHVDYTFPDGTQNLWVNLQFVPSNDGRLMWQLNNYGINP